MLATALPRLTSLHFMDHYISLSVENASYSYTPVRFPHLQSLSAPATLFKFFNPEQNLAKPLTHLNVKGDALTITGITSLIDLSVESSTFPLHLCLANPNLRKLHCSRGGLGSSLTRALVGACWNLQSITIPFLDTASLSILAQACFQLKVITSRGSILLSVDFAMFCAKATRLESLSLTETTVKQWQFNLLSKLTRLNTLKISQIFELSPEDIANLLHHLPFIQSFFVGVKSYRDNIPVRPT